jgi:hypothetical protein
VAAGRNEKAELTPAERETDEVVVIPELTEEVEERIFEKIQASLDGSDEDLEDPPS